MLQCIHLYHCIKSPWRKKKTLFPMLALLLCVLQPTACRCTIVTCVMCLFDHQVLVGCLEFQWDSVLEDRVLILSRLRVLHHYLMQSIVLSWEFFMNRLDTLALEAQVDIDQNKEFPFPMGENFLAIHTYHSRVLYLLFFLFCLV